MTATAQRIVVERRPVGDAEHAGDMDAFWVDVQQAGAVPPGLSQSFTVTFSPVNGPRYYFASIRVVAESGSLLLPLHAYPVPSGFSLPKILDVGRVSLGGEVVKELGLSTSIPLPFSVSLQPLQPHPDITVQPLELLIPPQGTAKFTVAYRPTTLSTASAVFSVVTSTHAPGLGVVGEEAEDYTAYGVPKSKGSAFGRSSAVTLTINGSSAPGMLRDSLILQSLAQSSSQRSSSSAVVALATADANVAGLSSVLLDDGAPPPH